MTPSLLPAALGVATLTGAMAALVRGIHVPGSQLLAPSVSQVPNRWRQVALTFNDGPSESTPAVLDLLAKHRVHATFFVCGKNVKRLPRIARAIVEAGHELGNHTHNHTEFGPTIGSDPKLLSGDDILQEMRKAQTCIHHHTGVWPRYFRAPRGSRWFGLRAAQRKLHVQGVTWSVRADDEAWGREQIAAHLLKCTEPGSIVCLHDGRDLRPDPDIKEMLAALDSVLPVWRARGFRVGTVHELMRAGSRTRRSRSESTSERRADTLTQSSPATNRA